MRETESIKNNFEFKRLYQRGKNKVSPLLAIYATKKKYGPKRIGITVSTKVGKAVVRNHVRRRIREAYRLHESEFAEHIDVIFVARVRAAHASFSEIEQSMMNIAKEMGLLRG